MRTNGFALFKGEEAAALAQVAAKRVRRYAREVLVGGAAGGELSRLEEARTSGEREGVVLAFSLERGGFPLIHGFAEQGGETPRTVPEGELSLLGEGASGFFGLRDSLGTRGLWTMKEGAGAGSIASDYRLLPDGAVLVPPGALCADGKVRRARGGRSAHAAVAAAAAPARSPTTTSPTTFEEAATELASRIDASVKRRVQGTGRVAVSFSGGLDSSLLALVASRHSDVLLCSAYAPGSRDERQSERAAALLGLELKSAVLDRETMEETSRGAELPPGDATVMDTALWCIYSATSRLAKARRVRMILLGQLADELFGGYMKYALRSKEQGPAAAQDMMYADVRACADRGFLRDEAACSASCEVRFPYADGGIARFAAALPLDYKIRGGERKAVLRAAALELGLPEELASAPKKAAQFSSGAAKLLLKISR